ncbi:MAG: heme-binding protein [Verrucomicrobiota bacterium]
MRKKGILIGVLVVILGIGAFAFVSTSRAGYETAAYEVVKEEGEFELRDYEAHEVATTSMKGNTENGSFGRLFRYISGANERDVKIAMTTPVFMPTSKDGERSEMQFVVPREVAREGTPTPTSENVRVKRKAAARYAAVRFNGRGNEKQQEEQQEKLESWIENQGLQIVGEPVFAGYDPPWTPGPLRRNEVLLRVAQ